MYKGKVNTSPYFPSDHRCDESSASCSSRRLLSSSAYVRFTGRQQLLSLLCCCPVLSSQLQLSLNCTVSTEGSTTTYPRKIAAIGKLSRYLPGTSEAQQRLEYGIEVGRDGCYARLTPGQYRAPSHMPFADTLCSTLINGCAAGGMGVWLSRSI